MSVLNYDDQYFMREALKEAAYAFEAQEIPIGAVVVCRQKVIARAHNYTERLNDVTAHAEMLALTSAAQAIGGKYLRACTLYVTVEPCPMCAGALYWSQIERVVYGTADPKRGAGLFNTSLFHPKTQVEGGILKEECAQLMLDFFAEKRSSGSNLFTKS